MKEKFIKVLSMTLLLAMVFSLNVYANKSGATNSGQLMVGKNSVMMQASALRGIARTTKYSYVDVRVNSVWPTGSGVKDNYTKCKTQLFHNTVGNTPISNVYTCTESYSYKVELNQGYLNLTKFNLCFAGNNPSLDAWISYTYWGN